MKHPEHRYEKRRCNGAVGDDVRTSLSVRRFYSRLLPLWEIKT